MFARALTSMRWAQPVSKLVSGLSRGGLQAPAPSVRSISTTILSNSPSSLSTARASMLPSLYSDNTVRFMNRNARMPKKANRGKRPCCNTRRKAKREVDKGRAVRQKILGFWFP